MRILITSDLHYEMTGQEPIRRLVAGMSREEPDLVVLAGDIGNPAQLFEQCLTCFLPLECPVAVVAGNHDVWGNHGEESEDLFTHVLPRITRSMGFHWLEDQPLVFADGTAVCGSIAWYDYSAANPELEMTLEEIIAAKPRHALDAVRVNWPWSDQQFAEQCRRRLQKQVLDLDADARVRSILAVTHVPVFESQMERNSDDLDWARGNAYFGHLTMGEALRGCTKLHYVVSGHTHVELHGLVNRAGGRPIATCVVGSDYGRPRWVTVEV